MIDIEEIKRIDREYGIVTESAETRQVIEHDDETGVPVGKHEDISVEFSYKIGDEIKRETLSLWHFKKLYTNAKRMKISIRRGENYVYTEEESMEDILGFEVDDLEELPKATQQKTKELDVIEYVEELIKDERERTGPMFG